MGKKQSKFNPRNNKSQLILQPRDVELLKVLYRFRHLKRDQIQQLFNWKCTTRVNARLRKLFDAGYLDRTFLPTVKGSSQAVYSLGKNAINVVSEKLNLRFEEIKKRILITRKASPLFFNHSLLVSKARIKLNEAFRNSEVKVDLWLNDLDCVDHFCYQNEQGKIVKRHFKPDSFCRLIYAGKIYSFFLEADNGTMGHKRISLKTKIYDEYRNLGLFTKRFGLKNFRILFVVNSQMRGIGLKSTLETNNRKNIWFIELKDLTPDSIYKKVWIKTFEPEPICFLQRNNDGGNK